MNNHGLYKIKHPFVPELKLSSNMDYLIVLSLQNLAVFANEKKN